MLMMLFKNRCSKLQKPRPKAKHQGWRTIIEKPRSKDQNPKLKINVENPRSKDQKPRHKTINQGPMTRCEGAGRATLKPIKLLMTSFKGRCCKFQKPNPGSQNQGPNTKIQGPKMKDRGPMTRFEGSMPKANASRRVPRRALNFNKIIPSPSYILHSLAFLTS